MDIHGPDLRLFDFSVCASFQPRELCLTFLLDVSSVLPPSLLQHCADFATLVLGIDNPYGHA